MVLLLRYILKMNRLKLFYICLSLNRTINKMSNLTYNRIKEVLARKRKQQIELATFLKKDPKLISKWCNNYIQPKYSNLFQVAEFLGVEAGELLTLRADL